MPSTVTVRSPRGKLNLSTPPGCTAPARPIACAIAAESSGTTGPRAVRSKLDPKTVAGPGAISPPRQAGSEAAASHSKYLVTISHLHVETAVVLCSAWHPFPPQGSALRSGDGLGAHHDVDAHPELRPDVPPRTQYRVGNLILRQQVDVGDVPPALHPHPAAVVPGEDRDAERGRDAA